MVSDQKPCRVSSQGGKVPGAKLTWLPGVGHYPMLEEPLGWSAEVMKFLES